MKLEQAGAKKVSEISETLPDTIRLITGDFAETMQELEAESMVTDDIGEVLRTEAQADLVAEAVGLLAYARAQSLLAETTAAITAQVAAIEKHAQATIEAQSELERAEARRAVVRAAAQHAAQAERQRLDVEMAEARRRVMAAIEAVSTHRGAAHQARERLGDLEALRDSLGQVERPELLALPILLAAALPS